jgi:Ca2+-binding RTX toxin-like protein
VRYIAVAVGDSLAEAEAGSLSLLAYQGSPDAPEVLVRARGVAPLVDSFEFRDFAGYVDIPAADYKVDVTLLDGTVVRSFTAPLSSLDGQAVTVLATGFVDPSETGTENGFELLAVLADGTVVELLVNNVIQGTERNDLIFSSDRNGVVSVSINGTTTRFPAATNPELTIEGLGGNDLISGTFVRSVALTLDGGASNDLLFGGLGDKAKQDD